MCVEPSSTDCSFGKGCARCQYSCKPHAESACRRLHTASKALDTGSSLLQATADQCKVELVQILHEADCAALALAVLVRLTTHAGMRERKFQTCDVSAAQPAALQRIQAGKQLFVNDAISCYLT